MSFFFQLLYVTIIAWTSAHCEFAVEIFLVTDESVVAIQRAFCAHLMLCQNDAVPDRKLILLWDENVRTTGSSSKRKPPGRIKGCLVLWLEYSTNSLRNWGSITGRVISKTQKMVLDASLLNTQHYKVRIKGKWSNPGKGVASSTTTWPLGVLTIEKGAFGSPSTTVGQLTSSSLCRSAITDLPDPLPPPVSIIHRSWQVFKATSCISTELLYIGSSWSSCICSSLWRGPQEYVAYEFVFTSPAVSHMSGLFNLDSFCDGG